MPDRSREVHKILTGFAHSSCPLINNVISPRFEGDAGEAWPVQTRSSATAGPSRDAADRNRILTSSIPVSPQMFACNVSEHAAPVVELSEAPAATLYAKSLNEARAKADSARNHALAHPKDPGSQAVLASKSKVVISPDAQRQAESHAQHLDQVQQGMLPSLTGGKINGRVIYRVQNAYNGIAMVVSPNAVSEIAQLPGVKGVHFLHPKYLSLSTTFQDIDFLRARTATVGPMEHRPSW